MKWAGGKEGMYETYLALLIPASQAPVVRDVCVGGGGLWLSLFAGAQRSVLTDINRELIDTYRAIRDYGPAVMAQLDVYQAVFDRAAADNDYAAYQALFYELRKQNPDHLTLVLKAARMIALNKTCFNGLYRKGQRKGLFNAPCGKNKIEGGRFRAPRLYDAENLRRVAIVLRGVELEVLDMVAAIDAARAGDVVLCDPPYDPLKPGGFTSYDGAGFTPADQKRTAEALHRAAARGCYVVAMNHDTPLVRKLYAGFTFHIVMAQRSMSAKGSERGYKPELLMILDGRKNH